MSDQGPQSGTHTTLIRIVDDLRVAIDKDRVTLIADIDLAQAFDRINIKLFIEKLRFLGFSDLARRWIESFCKQFSTSTQSISPNINTDICNAACISTSVCVNVYERSCKRGSV